MTKTSRSGLIYQIERILNNNINNLPKVLLLENVKALTTKKFINEFNSWIKSLEKLGYISWYKVLNSSNYGSAQNRERVFMISILNKSIKKVFKFPNSIVHKNDLDKIIKIEKDDILKNNLLSYKIGECIKTKNNITKFYIYNYSNFNSESYLYLPKGYGPTLTASGANSRLKFYFPDKNIIKNINSKEAYKYMGFTEKDYFNVKNENIITDSKMIYTCGNSISVEVLENIFIEVLKCIK